MGGLQIYFKGTAIGLADKLNAVKQSKEPRMTSRFGTTGYMLLLFTEKGNNRVVERLGEARSPPRGYIRHPDGDVT